jgi:AraC-like DNA-binding protein/Tfp pilus assembly protein PilF
MFFITESDAQEGNMINAINEQFACYIKDENNGEILRSIASFFLSTGEFKQVISYAEQLRSLGESSNNMRYRAYANAYLGQAYLMTNQMDVAKMYLNQALRQATTAGNDSILCSVYNGLGLFAANAEGDYNGAISLFFKGVESAKRCSFHRLYNILLCNISGIYYLKNDPKGLKYAQECYYYGHSQSDPFLTLWGAVNSSRMYKLVGNYEEALKYIKESEFILQNNKYNDQTDVYTIYGDILFESGKINEAEHYYREALANIGRAQTSSAASINLSYGKLLMSRGRYSEAASLLNKGVKICLEGHNQIYIRDLYIYLSDCYEKMGRYDLSLEYFKIYHNESSRAFNEESERSLNELRVQFDTERKENEAAQARLEVINKVRKMQFLLIILAIAITLSVYLYILYIKKNRLYRRIITQNREAIKREDELHKQLENFRDECPGIQEKYSVSSLKEDKMEELYRQIKKVMSEKELYRDSSLTKEKIADELGTNRTYLSQVINEIEGVNVTQFVNAFRINEAVRILSDTEDDTPLKAIAIDLGFSSISTFYKIFQATVGMTPSLYRKKAREFSS